MLLDNPNSPIILTKDNFDEAVEKYPLLVVDCWAEWCAPCKIVNPIVSRLASKYNGKVAFGKLNVDENQEVASRFGIMSIPTFLVFKNGEKVDSIIGALPEKVLENKIAGYK